ncbi:hypothetical protein DUNSADRAFT_2029 [Dunaliella salina]|uniref:Uncharacterized protein n=1 Tax=Dunaliella salina TaxID=3046 RepID=A0ABQ7GW80_DUNSA|nr:hypothetical protein DUNSADRAFT_2029 [Dunaliella salina]|eukprot:KAF5838860.1 hypothetical protein DUNSADRAFT_2029 [Dunaliella salina]
MAQCTDTGSEFLLFRHTEPINAEVLYSIQDWDQKDFEDYILQKKQDDIRPLLAFIAMGIISLIIFLVWRILRCCCRCCCLRSKVEERKQQKEKSGYAMTYRSYIGAQICKGFLLLLFLGLLALTIWGLITVDKGITDDGYDAIDAPFDYVDEVMAEVNSAGKPLDTIVQDKIPEAQQIVRVSMNDDSAPSSTAFKDALERSKSLVEQLYDNSTTPDPSSAADSLEALVEGPQRQQQFIDALDSQVVGLEQNVNSVANFDSSKLPTTTEYNNLGTDLDAAIANPSTANKDGLRDELNAVEGSTSVGDISSLHDSLEQISRLDLVALESSSAEAASPSSSTDGSLQALRENLRTLYEIATELSVDASTGTQQTPQGLLPFMDARLKAIGQDVVELTAEVKRSQRKLNGLSTTLEAMHSSGVDAITNQLPQSISDDPIRDGRMLDRLREVSGRLSGDVGDILAYVSAVREMLNDFGPVRDALDDHDANRINDDALTDRLGEFKDRVTAARSGQQDTDFAGFQASANNAQQDAQTAEQSYSQDVKNNLLSRRQTYEDVNQDMQQQQPPTSTATISSARAVASAAFPQQDNVDGIIAKFEREPVMELYNKPKCFVCKDAFDEFANVWYMLTFSGWLLMVMTWFANGLLGELDKVPRANACCPCACLLRMPVEPRDEETGRSGDSGDEKGGFKGNKVAPLPLSMESSGPSEVDIKKAQDMLSVAATNEPDEDMKSRVSTQDTPSVAAFPSEPEEDSKPRVPTLPPIRPPRGSRRSSGDE